MLCLLLRWTLTTDLSLPRSLRWSLWQPDLRLVLLFILINLVWLCRPGVSFFLTSLSVKPCCGYICELYYLFRVFVLFLFFSHNPLQCFSCATCRNRLIPGDRFHYINGTIFCEHDRPGAALHNSHLAPLQSSSVLTDQKVNKRVTVMIFQSCAQKEK